MSATTNYLTFVGLMAPLMAFQLVRQSVGFTAAQRARAIERLWRRLQLPIDEEQFGRLDDRLERMRRGPILGAAIGIALVLPPLLIAALAGHPAPTEFVHWCAYVPGACTFVGLAISTTVHGFHLDPALPRVARVEPLSRSDYTDPRSVLLFRLLVLGAALLAAAGLFAGLDQVLPAVFALAAIGSLVAVELLAERLAHLPRRARNELELRWDDGLRAIALDNLFVVPGLFAMPVLAFWAPDIIRTLFGDAAVTGYVVASVALGIAAVVAFTIRPTGRSSVERLHPRKGTAA
ncbi:hypothetical protein [Agromyces seonyuensis]|uniref:Uncharacterized protein n=1 Tax=Agromyces seonyuensis TaxID=2662446 RepID=A0A6I4NV28_9MICO|nr:hypothetical protein [Agromyces seonyuensis]MWB97951.1 hypothetical protein [Agromyces seonyuensis]